MFVLRNVPDYEDLKKHASCFGFSEPDSLFTMLHIISVGGKIRASAELFFANHNLSAGRFIALSQVALSGEKGLHPSDLAERIGVTRATITGLLEKLEQDDLIKRIHSNEDKRNIAVFLTQKGKEILEQILPTRFKQVECLMSSLTKDEKKMLVQLLLKIESNIEESEKITSDFSYESNK